ncbi:MAG TPA: N-acetyltransferase, partial [Chloroflexota bacterium]|nr:N-acetyltransferase [Chloroflexota bacterium]
MKIRPFDKSDADYARYVEIANANYPDHPYSVDETRHEDETWNYARYDAARWMAELENDGSNTTIGYGELRHRTGEFHPQKFWIDVYVHPDFQRRGYGDAIYCFVVDQLNQRNAKEAQTATDEPRTEVVGFLQRRGFKELRRVWESRLDVSSFDDSAFSQAEARASQQGITFTTLAHELARDPEGAKRRAHTLHEAINADVPRSGTYTARDYEDWITMLDAPDVLPNGYLIARHGDEWVAESCLWRNTTFPHVL